MKSKLSICLLTFCITIFSSYAQNKLEFYTTIKIGDTLTPYFGNSAQMLIFTNEQSCFTCMMSANALVKKYAKLGVESVMFIQAGSKEAIKSITDTTNTDLLVVDDKIGAYQKLYGIKREGVLVFIDDNAVVKYVGILGKSSFDSKFLDKEIQKTLLKSGKNLNAMDSRITLLYSTTLRKQNDECMSSEFVRYMEHLPDSNNFCMLLNNKVLYFYDSLGTFVKTINLQEKVKGVRLFTPTISGKGFFNNTSVLFINDDDFSNNDPIVLAVDYLHDSVSLVYKRSYIIDSARIISSINTVPFQSKNTQFITRQIWRPEFMFDTTKDKDQFLLVDQNGDVVKSFGVIDPFYKGTNLRSYHWILFGNDNQNNIYAVYALGRNLFTYNSSGTLLRSTQVKYDSMMWSYKWIERAKSYNKDTPVEEFMDLQTKVTMGSLYRIFIDKVTNTINIPLVKLIVGKQNNKELKFFIHQIYQNGFQQTIPLPNDSQPFYVHGNIAWCVGSENGCFKFSKIKIKSP